MGIPNEISFGIPIRKLQKSGTLPGSWSGFLDNMIDFRPFNHQILSYSLLCRKCPPFFWWFWWFCLLLNLWEYWKWRCLKCPILSPLLLNLWTFITAEPLRFLTYLSVYCWTFELYLLLNLWVSLLICLLLNLWNFLYCWTFEISKVQQ